MNLSKREQLYFDIMKSGNSLYLRGKPGMAKSAIGLSMSKKLNYKYIDRRLSQIDETDIGLYPVLNDGFSKLDKLGKLKNLGYINDDEFENVKKTILETVKSGQIDLLHFAVPEWAFNANCQPTIIHLEELNRANIHVRNAALQLLNERQIGDLKLNDNVLLMSSGNLGEADGTEVDEMDLALSNRLVIVDHDLPYDEWISEYAIHEVWSIIVDYIRANPTEYHKFPNEKEIRYASPRSWTNLSKFIIYKWGKNAQNFEEILPFLINHGSSFIGDSITHFIRYCKNISNININDVLNRWDEVESEVLDFNRSRTSEFISSLRHMNITLLNDMQFNNMLKFLSTLENGKDDELTSYIIFILDNINDNNVNVYGRIIKHFNKKVQDIRKYTSQNLKKSWTAKK